MRLQEQLFAGVERALFGRFPNLYRALYRFYKIQSEKAERGVFLAHVKAGAIVVDVGSNIGIYTELFAELVGTAGQVHAFEPAAANFALLAKAVARYPQVRPMQAAVGAQSKTIFLHVSSALNVDHRTYDTGEGRTTVPVACIALDDHLPAGARVDFIKLDIQGFEYQALTGMQRVLADNPHVKILLEYFPEGLERNGVTGAALVQFLLDRGFTLYEPTSKGIKPLHGAAPEVNASGYTNLFAVRHNLEPVRAAM
jgi:FkbM family methyltransferase